MQSQEPTEETYELKTNLPAAPPKPKPTNLDNYDGVDAEAKERIRRMIAQSRNSTAKMKEAQVKMAAQVKEAKKGDELFYLKEPNQEDMKKLGLD